MKGRAAFVTPHYMADVRVEIPQLDYDYNPVREERVLVLSR